jgi:hypothetical protein
VLDFLGGGLTWIGAGWTRAGRGGKAGGERTKYYLDVHPIPLRYRTIHNSTTATIIRLFGARCERYSKGRDSCQGRSVRPVRAITDRAFCPINDKALYQRRQLLIGDRDSLQRSRGEIGEKAFYDRESVQHIAIPNVIKRIKECIL